MSDKPQTSNKHAISEKGKHRLRIAAHFLRLEGHRFEGANFYEEVINTIHDLNEEAQCQLRARVDWVEEYEITEHAIHGEPPRSRARKTKTKSGKGNASRPGASGAICQKPTCSNHRVGV